MIGKDLRNLQKSERKRSTNLTSLECWRRKEIINLMINFLNEVKLELEKVTWPKRNTVVNYLGLVITISVVVATFVGVIDYSLTKGLEYFLKK